MRDVADRRKPTPNPARRGALPPLLLALALALVPLAGCARDAGTNPAETSQGETQTEDEKRPSTQEGQDEQDEREAAPVGPRPSSVGTLLETQVGYGAIAANANGYDYFYSSDLSAICRASVERPEPQVIVPLKGDNDPSGGGPEYVVALLAHGDKIYYLREGLSAEQRPDLWCANLDGSGATMLRRFDDLSFRPACLAIHEGRLLVVAPKDGTQAVMSISLDDQSWEDMGAIEGAQEHSLVLLTTEHAYFAASTDPSDPTAREAIFAYGLEDENVYEVYRSELGSVELLAAGDGRIVALERERTDVDKRLVSVSLDGSDVQVLEQDSDVRGGGCVMDGSFRYVARADDFETALEPLEFYEHWSIREVALSGGEPATLLEGFYAMDPQIIASGDHLVVYDAGRQMPNIGSNMGALAAGGEKLVSYAGWSQESLSDLLPR